MAPLQTAAPLATRPPPARRVLARLLEEALRRPAHRPRPRRQALLDAVPAEGGEIVIEIDPGMAFGTGQHPTTAMCLRALEERVRAGCRPSSISAAAPASSPSPPLNSARPASSRSISTPTPSAPPARTPPPTTSRTSWTPAKERFPSTAAAVNRCQAAPRQGRTPDRLRSSRDCRLFNIIVANISGLTLERLAPALAASLAPGGVLITSGFLEDAVPGLRNAYEAAGLTPEPAIEDGVWRAIIARKR